MIDKKELIKGFRNAGIEPGTAIIVHSSLSSLGWVDGGADAVVDALIASVGDDGTALFPTLTGSRQDLPDNPPIFDARTTPCWTGAIPETARKRADGVRSLHPTHSVTAFGRLAGWMTEGHERVLTPCGFGSPYDKLALIGGSIVLIGVTQTVNTSVHSAEEIARTPYVIQDEAMDITIHDSEGRPLTLNKTYLHRSGVKRNYDGFEPRMIELGICRVAKVGKADVRVNDAARQMAFLVDSLISDPCFTLAESERANW